MGLKNPVTLCWLPVGALMAAERRTGKIDVFMRSLGAAFGAMAAHAGRSATAHEARAVGARTAITIPWHPSRTRMPRPSPR